MSHPKIQLWAKFGQNRSKNGKVMAFLLFLEVPPEGLPEGHFRSSDRRKISHTRFWYPRDASQKISAQSVKKWPRNPMLKLVLQTTTNKQTTHGQPQICPILLIVDCEKFPSWQKGIIKWMNERMNELVTEWINEGINEQTNEWMNGWMNEWTHKWMNA